MSISPDTAALHWAIKNADEKEIFQVLEAKDVDLKATDENGATVLHMIFENKILKQKTKIIDRGNKKLLQYKLPGEEAREKIIINLLKTFIDRGLDLNIGNANYETVLHLAVVNRMKQVVEFLIERHADICKIDELGNSIAHYLVTDENVKFKYLMALFQDSEDGRDIENTSAKFFEWLIEKGFDFDHRNNKRESALLQAIRHNLQHILPTLLEHTKDIDFIDGMKRTLLHVILDSRDQFKRIYDVDKRNDNWYQNYSSRYIFSIVKTLIDRRVPVVSDHLFGVTACLWSAFHSNEKPYILEMIINYILDVCPEKDTVNKLFNELIQGNGYWNYGDIDGYFNISRALIAKGADVNKRGFALINHVIEDACDDKMCLLIEFLVNEGCDIYASDDGQTPLHVAIRCNKIKAVKKLIECGADVNCKNEQQEIPLLRSGDYDKTLVMAKELLEYGADINEPCIVNHLLSVNRGPRRRPWKLWNGRLFDILILTHWIKLKIANLPYSEVYDAFEFIEYYGQQQEQSCQEEIQILKSTFIDIPREPPTNRISLYTWLHMNTSQRYIHNHNEKLLNIVNSPTLKEQFPQYSTLILACYRETLAKKSLVEPAKETWIKLTEIVLPDICIERILDHLSKADLIYMLKREENGV